MLDLEKLKDTLLEKIKTDYANDVSLVHAHGSFISGNRHNLSDLDLFFVPKTDRGFNLGFTFILENIGIDFWALSWERLERIANHEEVVVSLLTEGNILYYCSEEDLNRFNGLKQKALDLYKDKNRSIKYAEYLTNNIYKIYYNLLKCNTVTEGRYYIIEFFYWFSFILSEINGIEIKKGRKFLKEESLTMPLVPKSFETLFDKLFFSNDISEIKQYIDTLFSELLIIIEDQKKKYMGQIPFAQAFDGWYEEMAQHYNKIYHAVETGDIYTTLFASVEYCKELNGLFKNINYTNDLPDMVSVYNPNDLAKIGTMAKQHQLQFEKILQKNNIQVRRFNDINELKEYLNKI